MWKNFKNSAIPNATFYLLCDPRLLNQVCSIHQLVSFLNCLADADGVERAYLDEIMIRTAFAGRPHDVMSYKNCLNIPDGGKGLQILIKDMRTSDEKGKRNRWLKFQVTSIKNTRTIFNSDGNDDDSTDEKRDGVENEPSYNPLGRYTHRTGECFNHRVPDVVVDELKLFLKEEQDHNNKRRKAEVMNGAETNMKNRTRKKQHFRKRPGKNVTEISPQAADDVSMDGSLENSIDMSLDISLDGSCIYSLGDSMGGSIVASEASSSDEDNDDVHVRVVTDGRGKFNGQIPTELLRSSGSGQTKTKTIRLSLQPAYQSTDSSFSVNLVSEHIVIDLEYTDQTIFADVAKQIIEHHLVEKGRLLDLLEVDGKREELYQLVYSNDQLSLAATIVQPRWSPQFSGRSQSNNSSPFIQSHRVNLSTMFGKIDPQDTVTLYIKRCFNHHTNDAIVIKIDLSTNEKYKCQPEYKCKPVMGLLLCEEHWKERGKISWFTLYNQVGSTTTTITGKSDYSPEQSVQRYAELKSYIIQNFMQSSGQSSLSQLIVISLITEG